MNIDDIEWKNDSFRPHNFILQHLLILANIFKVLWNDSSSSKVKKKIPGHSRSFKVSRSAVNSGQKMVTMVESGQLGSDKIFFLILPFLAFCPCAPNWAPNLLYWRMPLNYDLKPIESNFLIYGFELRWCLWIFVYNICEFWLFVCRLWLNVRTILWIKTE